MPILGPDHADSSLVWFWFFDLLFDSIRFVWFLFGFVLFRLLNFLVNALPFITFNELTYTQIYTDRFTLLPRGLPYSL